MSVFFLLVSSILQIAICQANRDKDWQDLQAMIMVMTVIIIQCFSSLSLSILHIAIFRLTETKIDKSLKRWLWSWQLLFSVFSLSLSILQIAIFRLTETKIDKSLKRWLWSWQLIIQCFFSLRLSILQLVICQNEQRLLRLTRVSSDDYGHDNYYSVFFLLVSLFYSVVIFRDVQRQRLTRLASDDYGHDNYYSVFFSLTLSLLQLAIFRQDWQDSQAMITVMTIIIQVFFLLVSLFYS